MALKYMSENRLKILQCLLHRTPKIQADLAQYCGYERHQIKNITNSVKDLLKEQYIIAMPTTGGRHYPSLVINSDINAILAMYQDLTLTSLQDEIRQQEWIREIIVTERFRVDENNLESSIISDIKEMLKLSPHFFYLSLNCPSIDVIANHWHWYIRSPVEVPTNVFLERYRSGEISSPPKVYYDFFAFCVFVDIINGYDVTQSTQFLERIREQRLHEASGSITGLTPVHVMGELMSVLKVVRDAVKNEVMEKVALEPDSTLMKIVNKVDEYELLSDLWTEEGHKGNSSYFTQMIDCFEKVLQLQSIENHAMEPVIRSLRSIHD